ncbi:ATP-dependent Clp protease proteolytic subunit [bioreactor metagenome]|uniref:ATP-dependent Clp protease proteolytic subunit n=1 Tax=bioreactor metagenome TaxID=1076179 RepID=A0A645HMC9_9ZZZZ
MAGDEILMSPTSILMIHNPWGNFQGEARDLRHGADVLDEVKETIINAYQLKAGKSRAKISQMMDEETWMSARKAVSEGFVDGMLYTQGKEEADTEPVENSFMFSRFAIQNSVNSNTKKFMEQYREKFKELIPSNKNTEILKAKLALECEL